MYIINSAFGWLLWLLIDAPRWMVPAILGALIGSSLVTLWYTRR